MWDLNENSKFNIFVLFLWNLPCNLLTLLIWKLFYFSFQFRFVQLFINVKYYNMISNNKRIVKNIFQIAISIRRLTCIYLLCHERNTGHVEYVSHALLSYFVLYLDSIIRHKLLSISQMDQLNCLFLMKKHPIKPIRVLYIYIESYIICHYILKIKIEKNNTALRKWKKTETLVLDISSW